MQLPNDSIGISDILDYRECPRRFSFKMRRHVSAGQQDDSVIPEVDQYGAVWARNYGSAVHYAIELVEDGWSDDEAIARAWKRYGRVLDPEDLEMLRTDLAVYHDRDPQNVQTLASEGEFRVPLMRHKGRRIFFRFKIDRLYERLDRPGHFIHLDYKSSGWVKSPEDIASDLQMWSYNWGIHEFWPECDWLDQLYDQLQFGQVPTSKSAAQREVIREFLVNEVTAILDDERWQDDGMLPPLYNDWCGTCPIMESCPVVPQLTDFALTRIGALAPQVREGRKTVTKIDPERIGDYVEELEMVVRARKILERFEESVKGILHDMPAARRAQLGYELRRRRMTKWAPDALKELHARLGPSFYELLGISKQGLESRFKSDPDLLEWALQLGDEVTGGEFVAPTAQARRKPPRKKAA